MIGCMQIIVYIVMTIVAGKMLKNYTVHTEKRKSVFLILGFLLGVSVYVMTLLFIPFTWIGMCIVNYITYGFFALLLTYSVCYVKSLKNK